MLNKNEMPELNFGPVSSPPVQSGDQNLLNTPTLRLKAVPFIPDEPSQQSNAEQKSEPSQDEKSTKTKKKKSFFKKFMSFCFWFGAIGFVVGCAGVYGVIKWKSADLPSITKVADFRPPLATTILARDGSLIGEIYKEKRYLIDLSQMPKYLPLAFLAAEDDKFYEHSGINPLAIARAAYVNFTSGSKNQGGSTITQQVVKRLLLTPEKSYDRKIKEVILAFQLERQLSKDDILTIYLNQIHLGGMSYGVEAGARMYFSKHASELTLAESAILAGILPATTRYNPYRNPEMAKQRQMYVLGRMRDLGWISDSDYEKAVYQPLEYKSMPETMGRLGGWYLEEVRRQLIDFFSEENSAAMGYDFGIFGEDAVYELGLTVHTSMDPIMQEAADSALRTGLENATKRHGWRGPIEKIESTQFAHFLEQNPFKPDDLEGNNWVKVLVTAVNPKGAEVRLGTLYQGLINVKTMGWARQPNKKASGDENSTNIKDATKVLSVGDVVWVSLAPPPPPVKDKSGKIIENTPLLPVQFTPETIIPLALQQYPDIQGAFVAIEPESSDVVALVGGYAFGSSGSHFNRATQAKRQPGSSFKPIVYSAALDNGFTISSQVLDSPIVITNKWTKEVWRPSNFGGGFDGVMSLRTALARSRNLCTVRIAQQIGMPVILERAKDLGVEGVMTPDIPVSLGAVDVIPLSMAKAYTAFANQGQVSVPRFIRFIQGPWGNTIYENPSAHIQAISPQTGYIMSNMLEAVVTSGTAGAARKLNVPLGGKTGTTNEEVDAWFIGITPHLVAATYIGYDMPEPMGRGETGGRAALPIYVNFAEKALQYYPADAFAVPDGIDFFSVNGLQLPFVSGTSPQTSINAVAPDNTPNPTQAEDLMKQLF